jgi:hypothetical protein
MPPQLHHQSQCSPQLAQRSEGCSIFFCILSFHFRLLGLCGVGFGLGSGGTSLGTLLHSMTCATTEQAEIVVETVLAFFQSSLAVLAEFTGKVRLVLELEPEAFGCLSELLEHGC